MERFKGIIALDIDGTVTVSHHRLEEKVRDYLNGLIAEGWLLIFLTGRTFSFAQPVVSEIQGSYFLSPQNGAALHQMPSGKVVVKHYISKEVLRQINPLFVAHGVGLLIESGKEAGDVCYYKPADFTPEELAYLAFRKNISCGPWEPVSSFDSLPLEEFAAAKYFAPEALACSLATAICQKSSLKALVISDPFRPGSYLALVNAPQASKGRILEDFIRMQGEGLPVIGAGDDYNDVEMLEKSSVKIVMQNAPAPLHQLADIIAPPADQQGIIEGLKEGICKVLSK